MLTSGKSIVGLDVGSTAIKAVELSRAGKGLEVTGFGQVEVPPDDFEARVQAISHLMRECDFNPKRVVTSVSGKMVIIRYLSMVQMGDEELRNAILFEAEKYIPFELDECVLDCQRLDSADGQGSPGNANVLLVAVKRAVLDEHMTVVQKAGVMPMIVDVDAFALGNAHALVRELSGEPGSPEDSAVAFVDVGASKTSVNILRNGVSLFTREIYFGGRDFTSAIARRMNVEEPEAESLKRHPNDSEGDVRDAVFPTIDDLGNELHLSFDYFESQYDRELDKIYLSGGGSRFAYFRESFEKIFEKPTAVFNPFEGLPISKDMDEDLLIAQGPQLAVAVGLAARIRKS